MSENLRNYYQALKSVNEWRSLLADPIKHWKDGKSAKELAKLWTNSDELPESVKALFPNEEITPLFLFPEYKVDMPAQGNPSHNDLYVLASTRSGYMVIVVEAKAGEDFGPLVSDWYQERLKNNDKGENAVKRLNGIVTIMGLENHDLPPYSKIGNLRWQLFHRTASAILEAKRISASKALVLIQSFTQDLRSYNDFRLFLTSLFGDMHTGKNTSLGPIVIGGIEVYFAWTEYQVN